MQAPPRITRRAFVRAAALGVSGLLLEACAPGPNRSPTGTAGFGTGAPETGSVPSASQGPAVSLPPIPLRQRIARLLVVGFRGLNVEPEDWIASAIAVDGLGGVILFDKDRVASIRNVRSPRQVTRLIADLRSLAPDRELIVAIDQEGGAVTRLSPAYGFPAVESEAAIGPKGDAAVTAWAEGLVGTLADVGVNLNLAPVVDLNINPKNPAIGGLGRAFSADPTVVARDATLEVEAHRARMVRTALKHFPGLGSARTNTDFGVADVTATWSTKELTPYKSLLGQGLVDVVMAANLVNGQFDPHAPASLSPATVTGVLREELGWDGVVITDDLQAGAITAAFGAEDAIGLALDAGNDLLLFANQQVYDPNVVGKTIDLIEGFVTEGRIDEARIDRSYARVAALFPNATALAAAPG
jgi:beta-N-acetylhexosaminidase